MGTKKWPKKITVGNVSVPIYRVKHPTNASGFAYVVAHHVGGARKLQKFASERDAEAEARIKAEHMNAGRIAGAELSREDRDEIQAARELADDVPLLTAMREWKQAREICSGALLDAARLWAEHHQSKIEEVSVEKAIERFLTAKKKAGVDTSAGLDKTMPKVVAKFGELPIRSISARTLQAWLDEFSHPASRNSHRRRLVTLFRWARKVGMLPAAAQTEAEKTDQAKEPHAAIGVLTAKQFARILELMRDKHPEHLAVTVLAGFCGLRRSELHAQRWEDVLLDRGFLRVTAAKSNTPARRLVPIAPAATEWLMLVKGRNGDVSPAWGIDYVRKYCRAAGIECPDNAFRHSFISHRVAATGDVNTTSLEAGNSPRVIFRHYRELFTKEEGLEWFNVLPAAKGGKVLSFG